METCQKKKKKGGGGGCLIESGMLIMYVKVHLCQVSACMRAPNAQVAGRVAFALFWGEEGRAGTGISL
jgi:hypothetical protein